MTTIQIYDKPMCCSTGVCGPDADPVLPRFAADLDWLKSEGHRVERFNLSQQPEAFLRHPDVHNLVVTRGTAGLPIVVIGGKVVSVGMYPTRDELAGCGPCGSILRNPDGAPTGQLLLRRKQLLLILRDDRFVPFLPFLLHSCGES